MAISKCEQKQQYTTTINNKNMLEVKEKKKDKLLHPTNLYINIDCTEQVKVLFA